MKEKKKLAKACLYTCLDATGKKIVTLRRIGFYYKKRKKQRICDLDF
jgi:hypothetical protein